MISVVYLILLALPSPTQPSECTDDYYAIDLVPTRRVPAARQAEGSVRLTFVPSPFGVAVDPSGSYRYNLDVQVNRLGPVPWTRIHRLALHTQPKRCRASWASFTRGPHCRLGFLEQISGNYHP